MELQIYSPSEDGFIKEITWNHEEIKKEVAEKVSFYADLVYTDEQIQDAKADRAKLRKFVAALDAKRKEIKKQCLAPYESFEKQMAEILQIVNKPILMIDAQVKEYEESKRAEKREAIQAYWYTLLNDNKIPAGITFNHLFDEKWLNASVNIKTVCKEMLAKLEQIEKDLATLAEMPQFAFEATEVYKNTLDINKAISEGRRLSEIQMRKAEAERLKAEQEAARIAEQKKAPAVTNINDPEDIENAPKKQWVLFSALLSTEDAYALKEFFNSRNIEFQAVKR